MKKRILLTMMLSLLFAMGAGSFLNAQNENEISISTADDLITIADEVNGGNSYEGFTIVLTDDITLAGEWTPIGNGTRSGSSYLGNAFKGIFDGAGNTISGLTITSATDADAAVGLFGVVDGGTVKNLELTNVNINVSNSNNKNAGSVTGLAVNNSTIDNITTVSGSVAAADGAGGIVGRMTIEGTISNCTNNATVTATGGGSGGIVGKAYYTATDKEMNITGCSNTAAITNGYAAGGIAGLSAANISYCTNSGAITAGTEAGGIAGEQVNFGTVLGNTNTATIANQDGGTAYGGIIGWIRYQTSTTDYPRTEMIEVTNNTNSGTINAYAAGLGSGGIVGTIYNQADVKGNINTAAKIEGGVFAAGIVGALQHEDNNVSINGKTITVSGNTTTTLIENITAPTGAGCVNLVAYNNDDNTFIVVDNVTGGIAKIEDTYYPTLQDAVDAATNGATVTVLDNISLENTVTVAAGKNVVLDLNGKTISGTCTASQAHMFMVANGGNLTVKDGTAEAEGKITYAGSNSTGWIIDVEGDFILESGTLELTGTWSIGYAVDVRPNAWGTAYTEATTFTMNGGNIISSDGGVRVASSSSDIYSDVSASFVMNDGEIDAAWDGVFIQQSNAAWDKLSFTINDGVIESDKYPVRLFGPAPTSYVAGEDCMTVALNSGTIAYTGTEEQPTWLVQGIICTGGEATVDQFVGDTDITASENFANNNAPAEGYKWQLNNDGTYTLTSVVYVAQVGDAKYETFEAAYEAAVNGNTITLLETIELTEGDKTYDKTVTINVDGISDYPAFIVLADNIVFDNVTVDATDGINSYAFIVGSNMNNIPGDLTIKSGTYKGITTAVHVNKGVANIEGGNFSTAHDGEGIDYGVKYLLNCNDANYDNGTASFNVTGGVFDGFNPQNNTVDGTNTSFVAEGYAALRNFNDQYVVGEKPTATVNDLGAMTIPESEYTLFSNFGNPDLSGDLPLNFVMQFIADQSAEEVAESPFKEWYADFVLTFTGIEGDSFQPEGCYLAGNYFGYGWVVIPVDNIPIEDGARMPVMLGFGGAVDYGYICTDVEDFKCALYLTPKILEANPNIQVNLELSVVDNSNGKDAAKIALEAVDSPYTYVAADIDYKAEDFLPNVASVVTADGELVANYKSLGAAIAAVQEGGTVKVLEDISLTEVITIADNKDFTLDLNGKTITGTDNKASGNFEIFYNLGTLKVTGNGTITLVAQTRDWNASSSIFHNRGGILTIENGNFTHYGGTDMAYVIDNSANSYGDAVLNVSGGLYVSSYIAVRNRMDTFGANGGGNGTAILNISGGEFRGNTRAIWGQVSSSNAHGEFNITGGTFTSTNTDSSKKCAIDFGIDNNGGEYTFNISNATINGGIKVGNRKLTIGSINGKLGYIELSEGSEIYNTESFPATIKKKYAGTYFIEGDRTGWCIVSTPVAEDGLANASFDSGYDDVYSYDEPTAYWEHFSSGDFKMKAGEGYLYAHSEDSPREISFYGNILADNVQYNLSYTDELMDHGTWPLVSTGKPNPLPGFNLIGNPFTHNITGAHFTLSEGAELANGYYVVSEGGAWLAKSSSDDDVIAPMEGVLVKTNKQSVLTIAKKAAASTRKANNGIIAINVDNGEYSDIAYASFNEGLGLDKINHRNEDIPMVFIPQNGTNYAIATMSKDVTEIPVSFRPTTMGQYTISVSAQHCEFEELYLIDKFNGEVIDILNNDYTFLATSNDAADRFVIRMSDEEGENNISDSFIYINNDELIIDNVDGQAQVSIYDVLGRPVASYDFNGSSNISTSTFANGVYIIRVSNDKGVKVQKIIID